eukprot:6830465-Pyramimonas_sp.AAC.1
MIVTEKNNCGVSDLKQPYGNMGCVTSPPGSRNIRTIALRLEDVDQTQSLLFLPSRHSSDPLVYAPSPHAIGLIHGYMPPYVSNLRPTQLDRKALACVRSQLERRRHYKVHIWTLTNNGEAYAEL